MSTKPYDKIIPDPISNKDVKTVLNGFSNLIIEVRNYGTCVMKESSEASEGSIDARPLIMLFRNIIEIIDSISLLVKESSIEPCKIILRTLLENILSIKYIVSKDTKQRASCFMVWDFHQTIKKLKRLDFSSSQGKQFLRKFKKDKLLNKAKIKKYDNILEMIKAYEERLQRPHFQEIENEYQRIKKITKNPKWYSLFGGPNNLEELAARLNLPGVYEQFYREWSDSTHGTDIFKGKESPSTKTGEILISQIRLPKYAQQITQITISLSLEIFQDIIDHFKPEMKQDYSAWYIKEIRHYYNQLSQRQFIIEN